MAQASGGDDAVAMRGRRVLVTGATSGIGRETARVLAARGADLVLVSRNPERCRTAVEELKSAGAAGSIDALPANLSRRDAIEQLAAEVRSRYDRLDVLVNNAGAMFLKREESSDGREMTLALNHFAYFHLTCRLLPLLMAAPRGRVVSVASDAHRGARRFDFDDPEFKARKYSGWRAYCQSKLANVLFTRELARRLSGSSVTANCLHPGFVASSFMAWPGFTGAVARLGTRLFAIPVERGALTSLHLATSPEVEGVSGGYFVKSSRVEPSTAARDEAAASRLWDLSAAATGADLPEAGAGRTR